MKRKTPTNCPCGLATAYADCCGRYIDHPETPAPTAEALMRSRYVAYTRQAVDYLLATWHADSRPDRLDLSDESPALKWIGLDVLRTAGGEPGDLEGVVEFVARYKLGGRAARLHEVSRFVSVDGRWYYRDGDLREQ
ncbi:MAG: YchJ family protein [Paludibacterium sp.]|uniref:YchJ family protein n=1 Tax=Paludibacterium sp. TaxID=1917523 RepID=UPI0025CD46B5|nr:YchJ family protein [Paludibacterium sp.]MBV8049177.1 YchJ family protein [Paludibacterium sp.]MBV8646202.1 YchJ family protein [Paludibacterium sp.]